MVSKVLTICQEYYVNYANCSLATEGQLSLFLPYLLFTLVYFPGGQVVPNVVHRSLLAIFCSIFKFWHSPSRVLCERDCCVWEVQMAVWPMARFTADISTFPPGVSRSDEISHVSHVEIKVMRRFSRSVKPFYE